jgi:hypothetical protein
MSIERAEEKFTQGHKKSRDIDAKKRWISRSWIFIIVKRREEREGEGFEDSAISSASGKRKL